MPPPGVVVAMGYKINRLYHMNMEDVEAIASSIHLGKKAATMIRDAQFQLVFLFVSSMG